MKNIAYSIFVAFVAALASTHVIAAPFYEEHFNTDTTNVPATYPQYTLAMNSGTANVTSGLLNLVSNTGSGTLTTNQLFTSAVKTIHVEVQLATTSPGNGSVLLTFVDPGPVTPGFSSVELFAGYAPVQFRQAGSQGGSGSAFGIGFVPALGIMHAFDLTTNGAGSFTYKVTEGTVANTFVAGTNSYSSSFTNPDLASGYNIAFAVGSGPAGATATFDNLLVYVPEPATCTVAFAGMGMLLARRRSR